MPSMTTVKCDNCKNEFEARVADRKRGWARFCSKSCKAKKQEKRTGQYADLIHTLNRKERRHRNGEIDYDYDCSWDAHNVRGECIETN